MRGTSVQKQQAVKRLLS